MPFILNEDAALKDKVKGIKVTDDNAPEGGRNVAVWFRMPEGELRDQKYPFITLDLINVEEDTSRAHRGIIAMRYLPEGVTATDDETVKTEFPIPYNLDYQITTHTRYAQHDRQIMAELLKQDRLPHRFGFLHVPQDDTVRRLDLLSVRPADTMMDTEAGKKRLFRKIFTVRVSAELLPSTVAKVIDTETVTILDATDPAYLSL